MPLLRKPRRGESNVNPTPRRVNGFIGEFEDGFQFEEFTRMILELHGRSKAKGDDDSQLAQKNANQARSRDWAALMINILNKGLAAIQEGYTDKIEDLEATEADADVKSLVELHGSEAVAGALFKYATEDGKIGDRYRLVGKGAQRRAEKQAKPRRRLRGGS